jgi:hypothetical protein
MRVLQSMVQAVFVLCGCAALHAQAQTTAGAGTVVVIPQAANIPGAFSTTVFVRNPNANAITVNVRYYQSDDAVPAGTGTSYPCTQLNVGANLTAMFDLGTQCTFTAGSTNNFGMIVLEDATSQFKTNPFFAYSRTESPTAIGFSIEGFPAGNFSAAPASSPADAVGLRKSSGAPHFRSNCFIGALNETVNYTVELRQGETGALIGAPIPGSVAAYHTTRILDIFTQALTPLSDYANVRAKFTTTTSSAMIGFCTVESQDNLSADFRIAKSVEARDNRQSRLACYGMDSCGSAVSSVADPTTITDTTKRNIHYLIIDQPDFVKCDLVSEAGGGSRLTDLQMVVRGPTDAPTGNTPFSNAVPPYNAAPYTSGGSGLTSFYIYTGEKSINGGVASRWYIDVSFRSGGNATTPIKYGIKCSSGNGVTVPWLGTSAP